MDADVNFISTVRTVTVSAFDIRDSRAGADLHRTTVATAAGDKLLTGRLRPVRNWTRRTMSSLFCAENYTCSQENQQKLLPPELHFLTPICTKSFVGCGFAPDPTGGAYSAPPDPLTGLTGLHLKAGEKARGEEGRERR